MIDKPAASNQKDEEKVPVKNDKGSYTVRLIRRTRLMSQRCVLCGESGHQIVCDHRGKKVIQKFAEMSPG